MPKTRKISSRCYINHLNICIMKFSFKAKTKEGVEKTGTVEASNSDSAVAVIQRSGLFILAIQQQKESNDLMKIFLKYYERVTEKELIVFFRQLAILIEARVPLVTSLNAISDQATNAYFKRVILDMVRDIEEGAPFSNTMEKHKDVFSNLSINVVRAGETSGNLRKSVDYVANNIDHNYTLSSRIRSALIYPAVILIVFFIIGFLVITFVLPNLTRMIKDISAEVPWYTQAVIWLGDFMQSYWWAILIIIVTFIGGIIYYINTDSGQKEFDRVKIRLPIIGPIFRYIYIARFAENLSVLLAGGIPIIRALNVVSSVINNSVYEAIILKTAEEVRAGGNMSSVLSRSALIPPMVSNMVKIGEESGQLESVLGHVYKFYTQETEIMTKNLSILIEPVLMIIIGIAVGFMAFAVLMPIYNIAGQIK